MNKHVGSNFEDFLKEEGIKEEAEALAIKKVIACMIEQEMISRSIPKTEMARKIGTSRSQLDRLLDPENTSVTLATLVKSTAAIGKKMIITFPDKVYPFRS